MKYWGFFVAKLAAIVLVMSGAWPLVKRLLLPRQDAFLHTSNLSPMWHDLCYTSGVYAFWLFGAGLLYLAVWDQRYRCRTCARRLRMPISRGSWSRMLLFGRPHTEYICPFGHGTLKVPELQIAGKEPLDWAEHQDMWKELELLGTDRR
jgi:hypothetical protein